MCQYRWKVMKDHERSIRSYKTKLHSCSQLFSRFCSCHGCYAQKLSHGSKGLVWCHLWLAQAGCESIACIAYKVLRPWLSMTIYDYLWLSMNIYDYLWLPMTIYDYLWLSMIAMTATTMSTCTMNQCWQFGFHSIWWAPTALRSGASIVSEHSWNMCSRWMLVRGIRVGSERVNNEHQAWQSFGKGCSRTFVLGCLPNVHAPAPAAAFFPPDCWIWKLTRSR